MPVCHYRKRAARTLSCQYLAVLSDVASVSQNSPKCLHSRAFILKSTDQIDLNLCLLESVGIFEAIYVHFIPIKGFYNTEISCTKIVHDM